MGTIIGTDVEIEVGKNYKGKINEIDGNTYQEVIEGVAGTTIEGEGSVEASDVDTTKEHKLSYTGKTEQTQYEGKNKIHYKSGSPGLNNLVVTENSNGSVNISGTPNRNWANITPDLAETIASGNYIFSINQKFGFTVGLAVFDSNETQTTFKITAGNTSISVNLSTNQVKYRTFLESIDTSTNYSIKNLEIMLRPSDTDSSYEPYVGGQASPNPNYPQDVISVGSNVNLLNITATSQTVNGVTFTINPDGTVLANGTATSEINFILNPSFAVEGNKRYTLSGCPLGGSALTYMLRGTDDTWGENHYDMGEGNTFIPTKPTAQRIVIQIKNGATLNNLLFKPKLEEGSQATGYSKYGYGRVDFKVQNKNFANCNGMETTTSNGMTFTVNKENGLLKSIKLNGTVSNYNALLVGTTYTLKAGTYKIIGNGLGNNIVFQILNSTMTQQLFYAGKNDTEITVEQDTEVVIRYAVTVGATYTNAELFPMILLSTETSREYTPHQEQTITIPLPEGMELCKIGNYKDYIYRSGSKWYKHKETAKQILTGNENWVIANNVFVCDNLLKNKKINVIGLCNQYTYFGAVGGTADLTKDKKFAFQYSTAQTLERLLIRDNDYTTVVNFKSHLQEQYENNTPVIVYFVLATPIEEEITDTDTLEALEIFRKLTLYNGYTEILSTSGKIDVPIKLQYNMTIESPSPEKPSDVVNIGSNINLCNAPYTEGNKYTITATRDDYYQTIDYYATLEAGVEYTVSYESDGIYGTAAGTDSVEVLLLKDKTYNTYIVIKGNNYTFTPTVSGDYYIRLDVNKNGVTHSFWNFVVKKGSQFIGYSKYGYGSVDFKVRSKNIFDIKKWINAATVKSNCTIESVDDTLQATIINSRNAFINNQPNIGKQYDNSHGMKTFIDSSNAENIYVYVSNPSKFDVISVTWFNKNNVCIKNDYVGISSGKKTLQIPSGTKYFTLRLIIGNFYTPTAGDIYSTKIMISYKEITDYIEYQEKDIIVSLLQGLELCKIGDYKDYIYKNGNKWYKHKELTNIIIDSAKASNISSYKPSSGIEKWQYNYRVPNANIELYGKMFYTYIDILSDKFKIVSQPDEFLESTGICLATYGHNDAFELRFRVPTTYTKQQAIDFINGTKVYYPCTIVEEEITDEDTIEALEKIQNIILYDNIVNCISNLNNPQATFELEYYKIAEDYDFYISAEGYFIAPRFNIKNQINPYESNIPSIAEASQTSVRVAGTDGDIPLKTTYEPIPFNIVCYTEDNLTPEEKIEEENKVNKLLNSIKNNNGKFAFDEQEKFYDVRYSGNLTTTRYPKHLKFSIPLKSSKSFAKYFIQRSVEGNATFESDTVKETGGIITIKGPAQAPKLYLNDYEIYYTNIISEGNKLVIDTNNSTVTLITAAGVKANAMKYYNHNFPKIENGNNELRIDSGVVASQVKLEWYDLKF